MNETNSKEKAHGEQMSYAALRYPASRNYLLGAALAMMADSVEHVISYWIIFEKFQSLGLLNFFSN